MRLRLPGTALNLRSEETCMFLPRSKHNVITSTCNGIKHIIQIKKWNVTKFLNPGMQYSNKFGTNVDPYHACTSTYLTLDLRNWNPKLSFHMVNPMTCFHLYSFYQMILYESKLYINVLNHVPVSLWPFWYILKDWFWSSCFSRSPYHNPPPSTETMELSGRHCYLTYLPPSPSNLIFRFQFVSIYYHDIRYHSFLC